MVLPHVPPTWSTDSIQVPVPKDSLSFPEVPSAPISSLSFPGAPAALAGSCGGSWSSLSSRMSVLLGQHFPWLKLSAHRPAKLLQAQRRLKSTCMHCAAQSKVYPPTPGRMSPSCGQTRPSCSWISRKEKDAEIRVVCKV